MGDRPPLPRPIVAIAPIGERASLEALVVAREIRALGVAVDVDTRGTSIKSMLRRANGMGASRCLVIGDSEMDAGQVQMKDLIGHSQVMLSRAEVAAQVAEKMKPASPGGAG